MTDVSMLATPRTESPNPVSYTAFATACSDTQAPTISDHHLDHMAFATTMLTRIALIASRQQMRSADSILLEPLSLNEAKTRDDWHKWQEAMVSEMDSMHKMNVFKLVNVPKSGKLIGVRWVYKLKLDAQQRATRYKARLVAQGYTQCQGLDYDQTFSPVVHLQTIRILLAIAQRYGLHAIQLDSVRQQLSSMFSIIDQGNVSHIIRLNVNYNQEARMLSINQSGYIKGVIAKFGRDQAWTASTPATESINSLKP
ncbi:hypothetical protein NDA18_002721 [Ustilago nuda]|nr:hypothetical protein NDA18_002721 [Ustilago nuda]